MLRIRVLYFDNGTSRFADIADKYKMYLTFFRWLKLNNGLVYHPHVFFVFITFITKKWNTEKACIIAFPFTTGTGTLFKLAYIPAATMVCRKLLLREEHTLSHSSSIMRYEISLEKQAL